MDVQITDIQVYVNGKLMLDLLDNKVTSSTQLERIAQQYIKARYSDQVREKIIRTGVGKDELDAYMTGVGQFKAAVQAKLSEKLLALSYEVNVTDLAALMPLVNGIPAVEPVEEVLDEEGEVLVEAVAGVEAIPSLETTVLDEDGLEIPSPTYVAVTERIAKLESDIAAVTAETLALVALRSGS